MCEWHMCPTRTNCEADVFAYVVHDSLVCDLLVCDSLVCDSLVRDSLVCDSLVCDSLVRDSLVCLDIFGTARHTLLPAGPMTRYHMHISMSHDEVFASIVHVFVSIVHAHINESP